MREECRLRVLENRVLRRVFGPKRNKVTGEWRRLHKEELYALYSSPNIVRVIKSRRKRLASHVGRTGEKRGAYRVGWGNLREGDHLYSPVVDERIILKWMFEKWNVDMDWIDQASDRDRLRALVIAVMNFWVP
jgi:hypothetical protein